MYLVVEFYGDGMPSCSCVMWVELRAMAAAFWKPWCSVRIGLAKWAWTRSPNVAGEAFQQIMLDERQHGGCEDQP